MTSKYGSFNPKKCGDFLLLSKSVFGYFKSKKVSIATKFEGGGGG